MSENHTTVHESEPIVGHDGIAYEGKDAQVGLVLWSLAIVAALAIVGFVLMAGVQKWFQAEHPIGVSPSALAPERVIPPSPQVQVHPWEDLPELHAAEDKGLHTTGRDQAGRMHIPIEAAINEELTHLKVAVNAPHGELTPGGQGREFSHTSTSPAVGARPMIEGEIRKNAQ